MTRLNDMLVSERKARLIHAAVCILFFVCLSGLWAYLWMH